MQNEGRREFLGKKSPGIQDFIFCAKKPGNKYKIQEIWGFCVENRGFAYHRREGGATRSHPVPSLWKTPKITKNCYFIGKIHVSPEVSPEPSNNPQMPFITPKCLFSPHGNLLAFILAPTAPKSTPKPSKLYELCPKFPKFGSKWGFFSQIPPFLGQNIFPPIPPVWIKMELNSWSNHLSPHPLPPHLEDMSESPSLSDSLHKQMNLNPNHPDLCQNGVKMLTQPSCQPLPLMPPQYPLSTKSALKLYGNDEFCPKSPQFGSKCGGFAQHPPNLDQNGA